MIAVYASSLSGAYVYDDVRHPSIAFPPWTGWSSVIADMRAHPPRSLERLSIALTQRVNASAFTARSVNLGWHLLNGLLVWALASTVLGPWGALLSAAIFWLAPIQTETVAYVSARGELVALTFTLLALLSVSRGLALPAWLLAGLAMTGKEAAVTALALVPLWAWWTGQRWSMFAKVSWAATLILPVLILGPWVHAPVPDPAVLPSALTAMTRLLALVVWPNTLTVDHDWSFITPSMGFAVTVDWVAFLGLAWWREWPLWGFALLWTLVALGPRLVLPLYDGYHERHLYTSMAVISMALAAALTQEAV